MSDSPGAPLLSLLGGPLHQAGSRLGLVRHGTNTVALGLAIGLLLWAVLIGLAFIGGVGKNLFTLSLIGGHVRLLVVIPLLFVCEALLDPRMTEFAKFLVRWQIVPDQQVPALNSIIVRLNHWQGSWLPETACLVVAALLSVGAMHLDLGGNSSGFGPGHITGGGVAVSWWYSAICLTVFRFLILRWVLRLCVWTHFLYCVSRLQLRLLPTHPDGAGGLGFLEVVHMHFVPLILSMSALWASRATEELVTGATSFDALIPQIAMLLVINAALFLGPLLVFVPKLWACRVRGLSTYMGLAERYVSQFDSKWLGSPAPVEPLLGTPDIQSLADLSNAVKIVRDMRSAPISKRLLIGIAAATLLPMLPLLLLKYPVTDLIRKLFAGLAGL